MTRIDALHSWIATAVSKPTSDHIAIHEFLWQPRRYCAIPAPYKEWLLWFCKIKELWTIFLSDRRPAMWPLPKENAWMTNSMMRKIWPAFVFIQIKERSHATRMLNSDNNEGNVLFKVIFYWCTSFWRRILLLIIISFKQLKTTFIDFDIGHIGRTSILLYFKNRIGNAQKGNKLIKNLEQHIIQSLKILVIYKQNAHQTDLKSNKNEQKIYWVHNS